MLIIYLEIFNIEGGHLTPKIIGGLKSKLIKDTVLFTAMTWGNFVVVVVVVVTSGSRPIQ